MDHLLEHIFMSRELYQSILKPVCDKYDLTGTELIILLFLDDNPPYDTATDIVEKRRLTDVYKRQQEDFPSDIHTVAGKFLSG